MKVIKISRYDYFKEAIHRLGQSKLYENPALGKKGLGLSNAQLMTARSDTKELETIDYLCLLSMQKIDENFPLFLNGTMEGMKKERKDDFVELLLNRFNTIYWFLKKCLQEEEDFKNMLRLFMRQPQYFFGTKSASLLMNEFKGDTFSKQKEVYALLAQVWFKLIMQSKIEEKDISEIAMKTPEVRGIIGRQRILEKSSEILSQAAGGEVMFVANGLGIKPEIMKVISEKISKAEKYRIIHNTPPSDKMKRDYPELCAADGVRVKIHSTDDIRLLIIKGKKGKCAFYCNSLSTKRGGDENAYVAIFTEYPVDLKMLEIVFEDLWKRKG